MQILLALSRLIDRCNLLIGKLMIWLIFAAVMISAGNALARKLFSLSSNAWLELQWYLYAAAFMLAAGATFLQNGHVRIDVLAARLSPRTRMIIDIAGITLFMLPLCYFMIRFSWPMVSRAYASGEMSSSAGGLIRWPVYAMLPAGFLLLGLQSVSELIKRIGFLCGLCPNPLEPPNDDAQTAAEKEVARGHP